MTTIGNKTTASGLPTWEVVANQQVASFRLGSGGVTSAAAHLKAPANGWITGIGARLKTASGSGAVYLAVWGTTPQPKELLGRTAEVSVTSGEANREGAIAWASSEHDAAARVPTGKGLAV